MTINLYSQVVLCFIGAKLALTFLNLILSFAVTPLNVSISTPDFLDFSAFSHVSISIFSASFAGCPRSELTRNGCCGFDGTNGVFKGALF